MVIRKRKAGAKSKDTLCIRCGEEFDVNDNPKCFVGDCV